MAVLVNIGQRGFILREGFVGPAQQITVDEETAKRLATMYPKELQIVVAEKVVEKGEKETVVEVKEVEVKEEPKKGRGKRKK